MLTTWRELVAFVAAGLRELLKTEFTQVRFGDARMAVALSAVAGLALLVLVARLALRRRTHRRLHSGYDIAPKFQLRPWVRGLRALPKALVALALLLVLMAAADPFLAATEEVGAYLDARVRIDLVDTSGSMAWELPGSGKSKAEVAREAHLKFLDMRRGKNDRVSLWLFATYPYMVDDFVTDDELYYFQVWDAPYVMTQELQRGMVVPRDKVRIIPAEGDTNIIRPLQSIVEHFDRDEAAIGGGGVRSAHRAVLIITDAVVNAFPDAEFAALARRNITPYIVYINTGPAAIEHSTTPRLLAMIRSHGGDYFEVNSADGLADAYTAIDEQEAVRVQTRHRALKVPIYSRFLLLAMSLLAVGAPLGFAVELFWGTAP